MVTEMNKIPIVSVDRFKFVEITEAVSKFGIRQST